MSRNSSSALFALTTLSAVILACTDIPTGNDKVLSFKVNPLPSPSVVVGDTLRDSLGIVRPIGITAYDFEGDTALPPKIRFTTVTRGIKVDSLTGIVTGDSVQTGAKILVTVGEIQAPVTIGVALRPDTMIASDARDSLSYSLTDTTLNISPALGVRLLHGKTTDSLVAGWRVSFRMASPSGTVAQLVNDSNVPGTTADTTDASGIASRRVKINVAQLTTASDSVVVFASASYRGVAVRGSPIRLVLKYKPKT